MILPATTLLLALAGIVVGQSGQCPTQELPQECICSNGVFRCHGWYPIWGMKKTFDDISDAINDDSLIFDSLIISRSWFSELQEIEANTITRLQFRRIVIFCDHKFLSIHPDAFPGTYGTTADVNIYNHTFMQQDTTFEFLRQFNQAQSITVYHSVVHLIPERAFAGLPALVHLHLSGNALVSIGDYAFADSQNLRELTLFDNKLSAEGISTNALSSISGVVPIVLSRNAELTHLPQDKFKDFMESRTENGGLYVGDWSSDNDPRYFLHCDERADWICPNLLNYILKGYKCKEEEFEHIAEYCNKTKEIPLE